MDLIIVSVVSLIASGLTLFSGFELGSILMPVMLLYFTLGVAVAGTSAVHLVNNLFKFVLPAVVFIYEEMKLKEMGVFP